LGRIGGGKFVEQEQEQEQEHEDKDNMTNTVPSLGGGDF